MIIWRFRAALLVRLVLLFATLFILVHLVTTARYVATTALVALAAVVQALAMVRLVDRTNLELTRFLQSIRHRDFSRSFSPRYGGSGFDHLARVFSEITGSFREIDTKREERERYFRILVEHVPVALLTVHADGRASLLNHAASRLFGVSQIHRVEQLAELGGDLLSCIERAEPGQRILARIDIDGARRYLKLSVTEVSVSTDIQRLFALQDIQRELDATELDAWQDLVRVLSHEIMSSITPVTSLARTAVTLLDDVVDEFSELLAEGATVFSASKSAEFGERLGDARAAVDTVARRSDGLMQFVRSYRRLTRLPPAQLQNTAFTQLFARLAALMRAEWSGADIELSVEVIPESLEVSADPELLDQALINLLRNAADAVGGSEKPHIWLSARMSRRGRAIIEVADNGAGIHPDLSDEIFVPFFTTKRNGSGIGLSLARQVMLAHGGAISVGQRPGGGALFRLSF